MTGNIIENIIITTFEITAIIIINTIGIAKIGELNISIVVDNKNSDNKL